MKRTVSVLRILQVLPILLALASCVRGGLEAGRDGADGAGDGSEMNGGTEQSAENAYYFVFDIDTGRDNPQTRATYDDANGNNAGDADYVYGTEDEHRIGSAGNYVFFFDGNHVLKAVSLLTLDRNHADLVPGTDDGNKIEARYTTILRSTDKDFPKAGWRVLLVFNGQRVYDALTSSFLPENATEDDVLSFVWEETTDPTRIGRNDGGLFVMTNSVYVDGSGVYAAVPITEKMIHTIEDINDPIPAPNLEPEDILTIRVERMVSKFSLDYNPTYTPEPSDDVSRNHQINLCTGWEKKVLAVENGASVLSEDWEPIIESRNWQAEILGWGMNALETENHLFKKINNNFYFNNWNNPEDFRSYWSEDPHYQEAYAWQFRPAVDRVLNWYSNDSATWKNILINYAWNDEEHLAYQNGDVIYTPENTYDSDYHLQSANTLDDRTELLAGTHLIVRATLKVMQDGHYAPFTHLYRDCDGVFYSNARDCLWGLVRKFNHALASQSKMEYRYYDWSGTSGTDTPETLVAVPTTTYDTEEQNKDAKFKLYYGEDKFDFDYIRKMTEEQCQALLIAAKIKDGDGKQLFDTKEFSIRKDDGTILPIYSSYVIGPDTSDEDFKQYDNSRWLLQRNQRESANDVCSLVFEWAGAVDYWIEGMMYYAEAPFLSAGTGNKVFGAVRNAWYRFKLLAINHIGAPVHEAGMNIVPNHKDPSDRMNVEVKILGWHEVEYELEIDPFEKNN